uniref:Uncharacterized protein n=1 Tax=Graphocephala atropunctata TaxID=36148 RepID=A0A1B6KIN7_9HEMI
MSTLRPTLLFCLIGLAVAGLRMGVLTVASPEHPLAFRLGAPLVHNLTLGKPGKYDRLLYVQRVKRPARRGGVLETVHYPPSWPPQDFLTAIHVEDLWRNGSNGLPYLSSGGLYQREATVRLESGPRYGMDFLVRFFGH